MAADRAEPKGQAVVWALRLRRVLPLLVTASLLAAILFSVDFPAVFGRAAAISLPFLGLAIAAMAANIVISSCRFQRVLQKLLASRPRLRDILNINLLTLFAAHFMPIAAAADGLRVAAMRVRFKLTVGEALEGVVHDRVLAVAGLFLCLLLSLPLQAMLSVGKMLLVPQLAFVIGFFAIVGTFAWIGSGQMRAIPGWLIKVESLLKRLVKHVGDARCLVVQCALAIGGIIAFAVMLYFLARGMAADLPFAAAIAFAPAIYLSQVVPFFYVGFGARETVTMALLSGSGTMGPDVAVSLSMMVGVCNLLVSLPGVLVAARYAGTMSARKRENRD